MTYSQAFKYGNLVLPSALLFHYHELFDQADDYLVWQFFFLQNTTGQEALTPNQIASHLGKTVTEVNRIMSNLTTRDFFNIGPLNSMARLKPSLMRPLLWSAWMRF